MGLTTNWIVRTKSRCKTYFDRKTIPKLTNSFTMMKFLAMFCLFIALFNEMEAKPIKAHPEYSPAANLQDDMVSERQDSTSDEAEEEEEDEDAGEEAERGEEEEVEEDEEEDEDEGEEAERGEEEEVEEEEEEVEGEGEEAERGEEEEVEEEEEQEEEDDNGEE